MLECVFVSLCVCVCVRAAGGRGHNRNTCEHHDVAVQVWWEDAPAAEGLQLAERVRRT